MATTQSVSLGTNYHHPFLQIGTTIVTTTPITIDFALFNKLQLEEIIIEINAGHIQAAGQTAAQFVTFINGLTAI